MDFNQTWEEYLDGFGDPSGDHWLGLRKLLRLKKLAKRDALNCGFHAETVHNELYVVNSSCNFREE